MKYWKLISLCILILVVVYIGVLLQSHLREHYATMQSSTCHSNFRTIYLGMEDYYKDYGRFPPAYILGDDGTPAHSWRILLLEYLEPELFAQYRFDQPWNSPENKKLESKMPRFYACPADSTALNKWQTNYFVVVGPGTPFPGMKSSNLEDMKTKDSTILLVESTGQGIHWMEPRDLTLENFGLGDQSGNNIPVENAHYETMRAFAVGGGMLFLDRSSKLHIRNMLLSDNDDQ